MMEILKVGWILSGSEVDPGARILGHNIHRQLLKTCVDSDILVSPKEYSLSLSCDQVSLRRLIEERFNVIVFQKVHEGYAGKLVLELKEAGIKTIFLASDLCGQNMISVCDASVAVSGFLKKAMPACLWSKITVIDDALEVPGDLCKKTYKRTADFIKGVYVGSSMPSFRVRQMLASMPEDVKVRLVSSRYDPGTDAAGQTQYRLSASDRLARVMRSSPADVIRKTLRRIRFKVIALQMKMEYDRIVPPEFEWISWDIDTVAERILECDIGLIPCELISDYHMSKSANRATLYMALGLPVIASPLPAYCEVIRNGENGFIAGSVREWISASRALSDERFAEKIGRQAREDVWVRFAVETVTAKYMAVFTGATQKR